MTLKSFLLGFSFLSRLQRFQFGYGLAAQWRRASVLLETNTGKKKKEERNKKEMHSILEAIGELWLWLILNPFGKLTSGCEAAASARSGWPEARPGKAATGETGRG